MKRKIKEIKLRLFTDDANGEYGFAHDNAIDINNPFNSFYSGIGIFHDVFEHSHEETDKYFKNEFAFNRGGEITAMAKMYYFTEILGIYNRKYNPNNWKQNGELMREENEYAINECITEGYSSFGNVLESNVPTQKPIDDNEFEYQIQKFWDNIKKLNYSKTNYFCEEESTYSKQYKKSVTLKKLRDLHRYGYKQAEKEIPNNYENTKLLEDFIDFWNIFTKNNVAEELENNFKYLIFKIYKEKDIISWTAKLISKDSFIKDYNVKHPHEVEIEETYTY